MKTVPIPTGRLLIVPGLPEDVIRFQWSISGHLIPIIPNGQLAPIDLPPGSWSLLSKASELTDRPCDYEANGIKENDILLIENKN